MSDELHEAMFKYITDKQCIHNLDEYERRSLARGCEAAMHKTLESMHGAQDNILNNVFHQKSKTCHLPAVTGYVHNYTRHIDDINDILHTMTVNAELSEQSVTYFNKHIDDIKEAHDYIMNEIETKCICKY